MLKEVAPPAPPSPPPIQHCYQYAPSTSSSACPTSYFALSCNFRDLAEEHPEFQDAWMDLRQRGQHDGEAVGRGRDDNVPLSNQQGPLDSKINDKVGETTVANHTSKSQNHAELIPTSKLPSSKALSAQITHAFNASLARALLHKHFQLKLPSLPAGRLCPPIPNRANYVLWLKELLVQSKKDLLRFSNASTKLRGSDMMPLWQCQGIDIGTGVSAIYPLLLSTKLFDGSDAFASNGINQSNAGNRDGAVKVESKHEKECKSMPRKWKFLATDIDPLAIESACANIHANHLEDTIHLAHVNNADSSMSNKLPKGPLFAAIEEAKNASSMFQSCHHPLVEETDATKPNELTSYPKFDFAMTNPPFYSTLKEASVPRAGDKRSRTDMSFNEGVYTPALHNANSGDGDMDAFKNHATATEGGEVGFISAIMNDSQFFRKHVTWYTSLVAKRSSLDAILQKLETLDGVLGNRGQIRTVEFRQGNLDSGMNYDDSREEDRNRRVRWGIAWTYERAVGRCSVCRVQGGLQTFDIWVSGSDDDTCASNADGKAKRATDEVVSRLIIYFEELRDYSLKCSQQMRPYGKIDKAEDGLLSPRGKMGRCVTAVEERFFNCKPSHLPSLDHDHDTNNLPYEGHFIIDAIAESSGKCNKEGSIHVQVSLEIYCHTKRGSAIINKIRGPLPGEIGRTNRRWRRFLKRQQSAES